ncbi:MAG: hypothetical protein LC667_11905 [Thioalkalivibrio sp.]|nr:hypothetical protein [Thioalkalivibrio sp.]
MTLLAAAVVWTNPSVAHHAVAHEMLVIQAELIPGTSIPLVLRFQDDSVLRLRAEVHMAR